MCPSRPQGIVRSRQRFHRLEPGRMRVMALNADQARLRAHGGIPIAVATAVNSRFPIAVGWTMALRAEHDDILLRDFTSVVIDKGVSIRGVVTIQTEAVCAMVENEALMLSLQGLMMPSGLEKTVAFHTIIGPAHSPQYETSWLTRRSLVEMTILLGNELGSIDYCGGSGSLFGTPGSRWRSLSRTPRQ